MLPPTRAALLLHTVLPELGPNYIAMRNKSYSTTSSVLPPVEQNSWSIEKGEYSCAKSHFASNLKQSLNLPNVRANQDADEGAAAATRIDCLVLLSANTMQGIV